MSAATPIRRWAPMFNVLSIIAIVAIVLSVIGSALLGYLPREIRIAAGIAPEAALPGAARTALVLVGALPAMAAIYVLGQMGSLFRMYAAGETLTPAAARAIRRIGMGLLAMAALGFVTRPLQILLASLGNPPGERVLAIGFDTYDLGLILAGGLLLTIGWAMGDAVRAARENAEFI